MEKTGEQKGIGGLIVLACVLLVVRMASNPVSDYDVFWHIKAGETICETRGIPETDPYSWTAGGTPWVLHEWLWQVLLYGAYRAAGLRAVPILGGLAAAGTFALLYRLFSRKSSSAWVSELLLAGLALSMAAFFSSGRPQNASYLLFAAFIYVLENRVEKPALLWVLPPLEVVWANTHGSFPLGVGLCVVYLGIPVIFPDRSLRHRLDRRLLAAAPAVAAASLANPYGWRLWEYSVKISGHILMKASIAEWHSPDFSTPEAWLFVGVWMVVVLVALRTRRVRATEAVLAVVFAVMAAGSLRHAPYFAMAASLLGASVWRAREGPERGLGHRYGKGLAFTGMLLVLMLLGQALGPDPGVNRSSIPIAAVDYMVDAGITDRVYNDYDFGGYLVYRGIPVFVDGRADLYLETPVFRDVVEVASAARPAGEVLDAYGCKAALVRRASVEDRWLASEPSWRLVWADDLSSVYLRVAPEGSL